MNQRSESSLASFKKRVVLLLLYAQLVSESEPAKQFPRRHGNAVGDTFGRRLKCRPRGSLIPVTPEPSRNSTGQLRLPDVPLPCLKYSGVPCPLCSCNKRVMAAPPKRSSSQP